MFLLEIVSIVFVILFAEDLDKTLTSPPERVSPKGDPNPEPHRREVQSSFTSADLQYLHFTATRLFGITF